jgi:transcriptional regulator with XRE-family HTH domain
MSSQHQHLRSLIARLGMTQAEAARAIGISHRQMQSYLADPAEAKTAIRAPPYVVLALERLAEKQ